MFYVDNAGDTVTELAGQGSDRHVLERQLRWPRALQVERLTTANNAGTEAINFNGNELAQPDLREQRYQRARWQSGRHDTMVGAGGDDTYYVDSATDAVIEAVGGGATDRVYAPSVSYTLLATADVERLQTTNNAGTAAINLGGGNIANLIYGNAGSTSSTAGAGRTPSPGSPATTPTSDRQRRGRHFRDRRQRHRSGPIAYVSYALGAGVQVEHAARPATMSARGRST